MGIVINNVSKKFGDPVVTALDQVSFKIHDGDFVALTGRSGSGKSTLLYILSTLDVASEGEVLINDQDTKLMSEKDLHHFRNQKMGFIFQSHYLLPELSALENVLMPTRKLKQSEAKSAFAQDLLERFGLGHRLHNLPRQLSGGEQQRVAIARSLVMKPDYLFADEPTGNLDTTNGETVMNILKEINLDLKTTIIMVTHDPEFAKMAKYQINLKDGRVI